MTNVLEDTVEVLVDLSPPPQPGSIDPAVLRRAMKFGAKCRFLFGNRPFEKVEPELRTAWLRREGVEWEWVRAAVRAGYEPESLED
jgi:hypothetical protein